MRSNSVVPARTSEQCHDERHWCDHRRPRFVDRESWSFCGPSFVRGCRCFMCIACGEQQGKRRDKHACRASQRTTEMQKGAAAATAAAPDGPALVATQPAHITTAAAAAAWPCCLSPRPSSVNCHHHEHAPQQQRRRGRGRASPAATKNPTRAAAAAARTWAADSCRFSSSGGILGRCYRCDPRSPAAGM